MNVQTSPSVPLEEMDYPESDGKPMSDNTTQFFWITHLKDNFDFLFRERPDVFVAGDLLWYPVIGSKDIRIAPDTMIVFGRPKGHRGSYMQWREDGIPPQVVWEVLSPSNRAGELQDKLEFYERYGVEEYYQYDPDRWELRGWLRDGERLRPIPEIQGWTSPRTGVRMDLEEDDLVLTDPNGKRFVHYDEARVLAEEKRVAREEADARVAEERRKREEAEARAERMAARLRALGLNPEEE